MCSFWLCLAVLGGRILGPSNADVVFDSHVAGDSTDGLGDFSHSGISPPYLFPRRLEALESLPQIPMDRFRDRMGLAGVGTFLLSRFGRFDLIPQLFGVIIGLHFLPFARLFRLSHYYWVGGVMIVGEAGSFLIPRGATRNIVGCAAIGFTLWVTGVIILRRISSPSGGQTVPAQVERISLSRTNLP